MSYPSFEAAIEDAFLDEATNARGELSPRQRDAVMNHVHGEPRGYSPEEPTGEIGGRVDLTLRRIEGSVLGFGVPPKVMVVGTSGIPLRPGLMLLTGNYECFVTKRPEFVVGIARPTLTPREIVERYRKVVLGVQAVTEADVAANAQGVLSPSQRRRDMTLAAKASGALVLVLGLVVWQQLRMGWYPLMLCVSGIVAPLVLFGLYSLIRMLFLHNRSPVLATEGAITSRTMAAGKQQVNILAIGDFEVPLRDGIVEWVGLGLPYRLYWTAHPAREKPTTALLMQAPYRSRSEDEGASAARPKLLRFVGLDLSEQPVSR